jgi:hypothetical protein
VDVQVDDYLNSVNKTTAENIVSKSTAKVIMFPSRKAGNGFDRNSVRLAA